MKRKWWLRAFVAVSAAALLSGASFARAYAEDAAQRSGLALLERLGPALIGTPQRLELNGERIWIASRVTSMSVREVLDAVDRDCARTGGRLASELDRLPRALRAMLPPGQRLLSARAGEDSGQLACFSEDGERPLGFVTKARAFASSGDLAVFGSGRYVVAQRNADTNSTHVLVAWTEGSFHLRALFPAQGDCAGSDSEQVSRPVGSVRLLSARRLDASGAVRIYKTDQAPSRVLEAASNELARKGFSQATLPDGRESQNLRERARAFFKDGAGVIVSADKGLVTGTIVSIVELESTGRAVVPEKETP